MEFWLGAAAGAFAALTGLAAGKTILFRKRKEAARTEGANRTQEREEERPAVNALEEQWNNLMRFNGTAQQGGDGR